MGELQKNETMNYISNYDERQIILFGGCLPDQRFLATDQIAK